MVFFLILILIGLQIIYDFFLFFFDKVENTNFETLIIFDTKPKLNFTHFEFGSGFL